LWHIFDVRTDVIVKLFIVRDARLVQLLAMWWNVVVYSRSIFSIRFHSIWPTRVELCACTSDRERSTHTSEASTETEKNGNPDSYSYSYCCLCELSLSQVTQSTGKSQPVKINSQLTTISYLVLAQLRNIGKYNKV